MYEINVPSTPEARYDGSIEQAVTGVLATLRIDLVHSEGGTGFGPNGPKADNYYGLDQDEATTRRAAIAVAKRLNRTVTYYDVDGDPTQDPTPIHVDPQDVA